jgi:hypothetical protein
MQQPMPAGVKAAALLSPHSSSVELRLAMEEADVDDLDDAAPRRLNTSRTRSCFSRDWLLFSSTQPLYSHAPPCPLRDSNCPDAVRASLRKIRLCELFDCASLMSSADSLCKQRMNKLRNASSNAPFS